MLKGLGIYAQRYNSSGNGLGGEFRVNTTTAGDQVNPSVAVDAGGSIYITWSSNGQDGSGWGVYGQQFQPSGTPDDGEFRINVTTAGDQHYASVGISPLGQMVVVWTGPDANGTGVYS